PVEEERLALVHAAVPATQGDGGLRVSDRDGRHGGRTVPRVVPDGQGRGVAARIRVGMAAGRSGGSRTVPEVPSIAGDSEVVRGCARVESDRGALVSRQSCAWA